MEEAPTPDPAVYEAFLLLLWTSAINVSLARLSIVNMYIYTQ